MAERRVSSVHCPNNQITNKPPSPPPPHLMVNHQNIHRNRVASNNLFRAQVYMLLFICSLLTTHTVGWVKNIYFSTFVKHQSLSRCNPNGDGTLPQSSCQVQCTHYITTIYSRAAPLHHAWESTKYTSNHEVFVIFIGYFNPYCVYTRSVTNRTHSQVAWRKITSKDQV